MRSTWRKKREKLQINTKVLNKETVTLNGAS